MPNLNVSVPYQIFRGEALSRIHARIAEIKAQYSSQVSNLTEDWNGYSGIFSGSSAFSSAYRGIVSGCAVIRGHSATGAFPSRIFFPTLLGARARAR